ncbi:uncharacterized protein LOC135940855 [Cloeon dipterum]|uniref:uncharacterized protein LOC135940855 n=1 Tax=Cloeon dipterum TaxID=197152 RepID=UPI00321FCFC3
MSREDTLYQLNKDFVQQDAALIKDVAESCLYDYGKSYEALANLFHGNSLTEQPKLLQSVLVPTEEVVDRQTVPEMPRILPVGSDLTTGPNSTARAQSPTLGSREPSESQPVNISSGDTVIFNPCPSSQALNNSCPQNAAICKVSSAGNTTHILGFHENATISTVSANTLVQYSYTDDDNSSKSTSVKLICAYNGEATTLGLILTSKEVCSTDVLDEANDDEFSSGATFLFIIFSLFAAYFFGGMAILKYIKGAQGVEMIPNHEFWTSLPSLVKDGFYFAMSGCRGSPSYDRI